MSSSIRISVVICTYNRAELLCQAIQSICEQTLSPEHYEVIVVDNNSTDHTAAVVESFSEHGPIRRVLETRQGHSHARNRGWEEAQANYIAYLDDDGKAPPHWLAIGCEIADSIHPDVFGGPVKPWYATPKPKWYKDIYALDDGHLTQTPHNLGPGERIFGGNLWCSRSALEAVGGFNPEIGMRGTQIGYNDEVLFQVQLRERLPHAVIYGHPELFIYHLVRPEKMTWRWIIRNYFVLGRSQFRSRIIQSRGKALAPRPLHDGRSGMRHGYRLIAGVIYGAFLRRRDRYPFFQNYVYEELMPHVTALGRLYQKVVIRSAK